MPIVSASGGPIMPGPVRAYTQFKQAPLVAKAAPTGGAPTGTAADVNQMIVPGYGTVVGIGLQYTIRGTQTIVAPSIADGGLDIGMDQTDNDGVEIDPGITTGHPFVFTVGRDACCAIVEATLADVSGADPFFVGFRKVAARTADYNDYTDFAVIGIYSGDIKIETALNNAATSSTDTTDNAADATTVKFGVFVNKNGVTTFQVNGAAPTTTASFTFDDGDTIMPFLLFLHGSDVAGTVVLSLLDWGLT